MTHMGDEGIDSLEVPEEIDSSKGVRGLHEIPAGAQVFCQLDSDSTQIVPRDDV